MSKDNFQPLVCNDNDVVSIANQVYKYGDFLNNIKGDLRGKIANSLGYKNKPNERSQVEKIQFFSIAGLGTGKSDVIVKWESSPEGIDCEILKLGAQAWKKGKIRVKMEIKLVPEDNYAPKNERINLNIEFCPDEPEISEPESPLDDIRRQINESK